jgi:hypothetical protein
MYETEAKLDLWLLLSFEVNKRWIPPIGWFELSAAIESAKFSEWLVAGST